jgi:diacylglycerol kinase (ATP)
MRWLAIANPAAGRAREAERMLSRLARAGRVQHEAVRTSAPGDATRLAREAAAFDGFIAVGGDGTIAEVLQGMDLARQHLAVLPAGHGNCLARDLGVGEAGSAVESLRAKALLPVDLVEVVLGFADGRVERLLCASTIAAGYVADVVCFGRRRLSLLGRAAYAMAAMVVAPRWFDATLAEVGNPARSRSYTGIVVNNTAHLANFRGLPDASLDDGMLDVMEQGYHWPRQLLHNLAVLTESRRFGPLALRRLAAGEIAFNRPATVMVDGELFDDVVRLSFACRPAAVRCVVGRR